MRKRRRLRKFRTSILFIKDTFGGEEENEKEEAGKDSIDEDEKERKIMISVEDAQVIPEREETSIEVSQVKEVQDVPSLSVRKS